MSESISRYVTETLPLLPRNIPAIVTSFTFFFLLTLLSASLSPSFFPTPYKSLTTSRQRLDWHAHVCSLAHCMIVLPLALIEWQRWSDRRMDIFSTHPSTERMAAITIGYALFEFLLEMQISGWRGSLFVMHAFISALVYLNSYQSFLFSLGPAFTLWQFSTPWLNMNWFMDRSPKWKDSTSQLIVGVLFAVTFFLARTIFGNYATYLFFTALWKHRARLSTATLIGYSVGNIALTSLNFFWLWKIIQKVQRKFGKASAPAARAGGKKPRSSIRKEQ